MINEREIEELMARAKDRMKSALLKPYKDILTNFEWSNYEEHIKWIAEAPFEEIVEWCQTGCDPTQ